LDCSVFERAILRVFNFVVSDRDFLRLQYHFEGDAVTWAASADADSVKKVLAYSVETYVRAPLGSLAVETTRKGFVVKPSFLLSSLQTIMTIAGHVSQKMVARYSHVRIEARWQAVGHS